MRCSGFEQRLQEYFQLIANLGVFLKSGGVLCGVYFQIAIKINDFKI